jgi:hypothetical protein
MDFKLIVNPLFRTAVYSDETTIRAVAMDKEYKPVARYEHRMSRAKKTVAHSVHKALFPFSVQLNEKAGGYLNLSVQSGGLFCLVGMITSVAFLTVWRRVWRRRWPRTAESFLVFLTGIYGLIASTIIEVEQ